MVGTVKDVIDLQMSFQQFEGAQGEKVKEGGEAMEGSTEEAMSKEEEDMQKFLTGKLVNLGWRGSKMEINQILKYESSLLLYRSRRC